MYAVAAEGVVTAGACMPELEMDEAPALVGATFSQARSRAMEAASCMATPVMSSRTNGETITRQAARLNSEAEAQLRLRYAAEVGYGASRTAVPPARRRREESRKRSLDQADPGLPLGGGGEPEDGGGAAPARRPVVTAPSPETKRLLAARVGLLEDASNK